jgi:hypothetical protein
MNATMISKAQGYAAIGLARAFGHWWESVITAHSNGGFYVNSRYFGTEYNDPAYPCLQKLAVSQEELIELLEEAAAAANDEWVGVLPTWEGDTMVHQTATGRLRWRIRPEGRVDLEVHRPNIGAVLKAEVWASDDAGTPGKLGALGPVGNEYCVRHVMAAKEALTPLLGRYAATIAVAELVVGAADYEEINNGLWLG